MEFEFDGVIFHWRGPSPFHFVAVPEDDGEVIHDHAGLVTYGWGMIPATVTVGATEWTTALFPKDGSYLVPVKDAVRRAEGLEPGDGVSMRLSISIAP